MATQMSFESKLVALKSGIDTVLSKNDSVPIGGSNVTQAKLSSQVGAMVAPFTAADETREAHKQQLADRDATLKPSKKAYRVIVQALLVYYGDDSASLAKFGLAPRKEPAPLTGEQRVAAAAKAKATKQLRGTLTKKEKAALKATGTFTVSVNNDAPNSQPITSSEPAAGSASNGVAPMLMNGGGH